jgi:hypothetical protein
LERRSSSKAARRATLPWLLAALLWVACAQPDPPAAPSPPPPCTPRFPYQDGWLGGDAAYSIALPSDTPETRRTLWLFGDSFVADAPQSDRVGSQFIHNSIAISECGAQGFAIEYYWRRDEHGDAAAFFDSGTEDPYWWLFGGFIHEGALYVGLLEIATAEPEAALGLPFRMVGMRLARVANPEDRPLAWRIETTSLSRSEQAFPGASMLVRDEHAYLFAFTALREGRQPRFLSRLSLRALGSPLSADLWQQLETLTPEGEWIAGFVPERAALLMDDNASEMSVEYDASSQTWIAIYGSPVQSDEPATARQPSDRIYLRSATRLEGPWSERREIHRIEELGAGGEPALPNVVCYAAKGHQRFAPAGRLLLTYVCNVFTPPGEDPGPSLRTLASEMDIYTPRTVVLPLPADLMIQNERLPDRP